MSNAQKRSRRDWIAGMVMAVAALTARVPAWGQGDASGAGGQRGAASRPSAATPATRPASLPHIAVDRARRIVDLEATVTMREGKWLELLACTPQTRQHESILTTEAKPSHLHLALILIGLQPGHPFKGERVGDEVRLRLPAGPKVAVSIVVRREGREIETPAHEWILDHNSGKTMADNIWLFTGSEMVEFEGQSTYRADPNGTVISLVNFGDDPLSRPTDRTHENDGAMWGPHAERIPPLGTAVLIRLRPATATTAPGTRSATAPATRTGR